MARYIDVEEVKKFFDEMDAGSRERGVMLLTANEFLEYLDEIPTADTVEVVRCKDCIHRDPEDKKCDGTFQAKCGMFQMDDNDFCSYGERRKEDVSI